MLTNEKDKKNSSQNQSNHYAELVLRALGDTIGEKVGSVFKGRISTNPIGQKALNDKEKKILNNIVVYLVQLRGQKASQPFINNAKISSLLEHLKNKVALFLNTSPKELVFNADLIAGKQKQYTALQLTLIRLGCVLEMFVYPRKCGKRAENFSNNLYLSWNGICTDYETASGSKMPQELACLIQQEDRGQQKELQQQLDNTKEQLEKTKRENEQLRKNQEEEQKRLDEQKDIQTEFMHSIRKANTLELDNARLTGEMQQTSQKLQSRITELEKENNKQKLQLIKALGWLEVGKKQEEELEKTKQQINQQTAHYKQKIQESQETINSLKKLLTTTNSDFQARIDQQQKKIQNLQNKIDQLQMIIQTLHQKNDRLIKDKNAETSTSEEYERRGRELRRLHETTEQQEKRIHALTDQIALLRQENDDHGQTFYAEKIEPLQKENHILHQRQHDHERSMTQANGEITSLTQQLDSLQKSRGKDEKMQTTRAQDLKTFIQDNALLEEQLFQLEQNMQDILKSIQQIYTRLFPHQQLPQHQDMANQSINGIDQLVAKITNLLDTIKKTQNILSPELTNFLKQIGDNSFSQNKNMELNNHKKQIEEILNLLERPFSSIATSENPLSLTITFCKKDHASGFDLFFQSIGKTQTSHLTFFKKAKEIKTQITETLTENYTHKFTLSHTENGNILTLNQDQLLTFLKYAANTLLKFEIDHAKDDDATQRRSRKQSHDSTVVTQQHRFSATA